MIKILLCKMKFIFAFAAVAVCLIVPNEAFLPSASTILANREKTVIGLVNDVKNLNISKYQEHLTSRIEQIDSTIVKFLQSIGETAVEAHEENKDFSNCTIALREAVTLNQKTVKNEIKQCFKTNEPKWGLLNFLVKNVTDEGPAILARIKEIRDYCKNAPISEEGCIRVRGPVLGLQIVAYEAKVVYMENTVPSLLDESLKSAETCIVQPVTTFRNQMLTVGTVARNCIATSPRV